MTMEFTRPRASSPWITVLRMIGGAVIGAGVAFLFFSYVRDLRWADVVALILSVVCCIGAGRLYLDTFNRDALAKMLSLEGQPTDAEVTQVRWQAAMLGVLGLSLIWPVLATIGGVPAPLWTYAVVAAALIANLWFTYRAFEHGDEFARQRLLNFTWRASLIGQALLIGYAGAERLGIVPVLTAWDVFIVLTAVSVFVPLLPASKKV